jgi:hypothetical protein
MPFKKHNWFLLTLLATSLFSIAALNRFMDPYALFDGPWVEGINADRPGQELRSRPSRAEQIRRIKPAAIALGSSRTEFGIDPEHPGWGVDSVYNCGLGDGRIYEMYRFLQHAHAVRQQEKVVVMLDMFQFKAEQYRPSFSEERLAVDSLGRPQPKRLSEERCSLLTLDAIWASVKLWLGQGLQPRIMQPNGMLDGEYYLAHFKKKGGHHQAFKVMDQAYFEGSFQSLAKGGIPDESYQAFRDLLAFCHRERLDLRLGISPHHVRLFEGMQKRGLMPLYASWKQELLQISKSVAAEFGHQPYVIYDFSGNNQYNTERVPTAENPTAQMRWHWEQTHYKKQLGDLVLNVIFEDDMRPTGRAVAASSRVGIDDGFGRRLGL